MIFRACRWLLSLPRLLLLPACSQPVQRAAPASSSDLIDAYLRAWHVRNPGERDSVLFDNSASAYERWGETQRAFLQRAVRLRDREGSDNLEVELLFDYLEASIQFESCRRQLWNVSPLTGWLPEYMAYARRQPVGTPESRTRALARWARLVPFIDTEIANLQTGLRLGYVAPRQNVTATIAQVEGVLKTEATSSPFYAPATNDGDSAFKSAFGELVAERIQPAVRRYRDFLQQEYLPRARTTVGVSDIPHGRACFDALIRRYTSAALTSKQLDSLGHSLLVRVRATAQARTQDTVTGYRTPAAVLAHADSLVKRAASELPKWFSGLPAAASSPPRVEAMPDAGPDDASAIYVPAGETSGAKILINTQSMLGKEGALYLDRVVFHEGIPGHHVQAVMARSANSSRLARILLNTAYVEGWAVYASNLADQAGLYSSEVARTPVRTALIDDALVFLVQSGLHTHDWTAAAAADTIRRLSGASKEEAEQQVRYFVAAPAHALAYPVGARTIEELRARAQRRLGSRFDIRAFHQAVLQRGAMPLSLLSRVMGAWQE